MAHLNQPGPRDRLPDIAVEVQLPILIHLRKLDIWRCLRVSKRWKEMILGPVREEARQTFAPKDKEWVKKWVLGTEPIGGGDDPAEYPHVLRGLATKHFPGLMQHSYVTKGSTAFLASLFEQAIENFFLRSQGKFRYALDHRFSLEDNSYFELDPTFHPGEPEDYYKIFKIDGSRRYGPESSEYLYFDKRIAWQPRLMPRFIVIDDLRTRYRKLFAEPGLPQPGDSLRLAKELHPETRNSCIDRWYLEALGDELVVSVGELGRKMAAWDIQSGTRAAIELSDPCFTAKTMGKRVGILTSQRRIMVWKIWGPLLFINWDGLGTSPSISLRNLVEKQMTELILHPLHPDVLYVVLFNKLASATRIHVYVGEECQAVFSRSLTELSVGLRTATQLQFKTLCTQLDAHGGYSVGTVFERAAARPRRILCPELGASPSQPTMLLVSFNIYTRSFSTTVYQGMFDGIDNDTRLHLARSFWGRQLTFWVKGAYCPEEVKNLAYKLPVLAMHECRGEQAAHKETPLLYTKILTPQEQLERLLPGTARGPGKKVPLFGVIKSFDCTREMAPLAPMYQEPTGSLPLNHSRRIMWLRSRLWGSNLNYAIYPCSSSLS